MARDTLIARFQLEADFQTIQAIRQALAEPEVQARLVSRLSETTTAFLTIQVDGDFALEGALKVSAVSQIRSGPRLPTPKMVNGLLSWYDPDADITNVVGEIGSQDCMAWLEATPARSFRYESEAGSFTAIREKRRGRLVWYAHRRRKGRLKRAYLGQTQNLTPSRLAQTAAKLNSNQDSLTTE